MKYLTLYLLLLMHFDARTQSTPELTVKQTPDFNINGKGDNPAWQRTNWITLQQLDKGGPAHRTQFKILYSSKGIYVLFHGTDQRITTRYDKDFDDLYEGDVFEVFLQPDQQLPVYFEYEVNALDKELVLLIPNRNGAIMGWLPWKYEGDRKVQKKIFIENGQPVMNGSISAWSAELFFAYTLLHPLTNSKPESGTVWKGNFYRLDYDTGKMIKWAWSPVARNFHEPERFGLLTFE